MRGVIRGAAIVGMLCTANVWAQSNVNPVDKFAWSETGWTNWRDAGAGLDGVILTSTYLTGYVWTEVGWLDVGRVPANGTTYANLDETDYGVNVAPNGDLSGYAWSEVGWVNFDTSSKSPDHARFDYSTGRFRGYVWSETGWINLDDSTYFIATLGGGSIPAVSDWGLIVMTLLVLALGTLVYMRREPARMQVPRTRWQPSGRSET